MKPAPRAATPTPRRNKLCCASAPLAERPPARHPPNAKCLRIVSPKFLERHRIRGGRKTEKKQRKNTVCKHAKNRGKTQKPICKHVKNRGKTQKSMGFCVFPLFLTCLQIVFFLCFFTVFRPRRIQGVSRHSAT